MGIWAVLLVDFIELSSWIIKPPPINTTPTLFDSKSEQCLLYPLQILLIHPTLLHQDHKYAQCHHLIEVRYRYYNLYFSIILLNTFLNNITNFIRSNGYHEYFLILFWEKKNAYSHFYFNILFFVTKIALVEIQFHSNQSILGCCNVT